MDDWQKCFSQTRKRHYYFNSKLNKSVWTFQETLLPIMPTEPLDDPPPQLKRADKSDKKSEITNKIVKAKTLLSTKSDILKVSEKKQKLLATTYTPPSKSKGNFKKEEEEPEAMEIDEIIENIQKLRSETGKDGSQIKNKVLDSQLKDCELIASVKNIGNIKIKSKTVAVLDTNVLLSNIKSLEKNFPLGKNSVTFVIPWIVVQELDNCKSKNHTTSINIRSNRAIKYIHSVLSVNADSFIFETSKQNSQQIEILECLSNDDQILKCALRYHTTLTNTETILVTNDKNLVNKGLIYKVKSMSYDEFLLRCLGFNVNNSNVKKNLIIEGTSKQLIAKDNAMDLKVSESKLNTIVKDYTIDLDRLESDAFDVEMNNLNEIKKNRKKSKSKQNEENVTDSIVPGSILKMINGDLCDEQNILNNMVYIKTSKIFLTKLLRFIEREIVSSIKKVCYYFTEETSNRLEHVVCPMRNAFQSLTFGSCKEKSSMISQCFEQMKNSAVEFDKINMYLSNNILNTLEKLKLALTISSRVIGIFEIYDKKDYLESFSMKKIENSLIILNYMKFCNENGAQVCTIFDFTEKFDLCNQSDQREQATECDLLFQPIWEKLHNYSLVVQNLATNSLVVDQIKPDFVLFYQMNVCYLSIEYIHMFYNDYYKVKTLKNLVNLSFLIYMLYKLLAIEGTSSPVQPLSVIEEFKKYQIIWASLKWSFRSENNETMLNGLKQLEGFLSIYRQLDQKTYENFFVA